MHTRTSGLEDNDCGLVVVWFRAQLLSKPRQPVYWGVTFFNFYLFYICYTSHVFDFYPFNFLHFSHCTLFNICLIQGRVIVPQLLSDPDQAAHMSIIRVVIWILPSRQFYFLCLYFSYFSYLHLSYFFCQNLSFNLLCIGCNSTIVI